MPLLISRVISIKMQNLTMISNNTRLEVVIQFSGSTEMCFSSGRKVFMLLDISRIQAVSATVHT